MVLAGGGIPTRLLSMSEPIAARTESDLPMNAVYDAAALGASTRSEARRAREVPVHPGRLPDDVHRQAVDDAAVCRLRHRQGEQRALPPARRCGHWWLSVAFDLPTQMGYDSDNPIASGEVGKVGVAVDSPTTCGSSSTGCRWTRSRRR